MKDTNPHVHDTAQKHPANQRLLTYDDYRKTPPGQRFELVEGVLRRMDAPTISHHDLSRRLERLLYDQLESTGRGRVFRAPVDIVLSNHNVVQPDLLFVASDRLETVGRANIAGAPDLAVEILSPSTERWDRHTKRQLYAKYGVREYWLVDLESQTVEVMSLTMASQGAELTSVGIYGIGSRVRSPLLPEIVIEVAGLFEDPWGLR